MSEFTVSLSHLCLEKDLKEKHQPTLSEFMSWKDKGQKHTPTSQGWLCEKMPTCGESTLARVSQTIYFITAWSDTKSTVIPLSQGCTRSLCLLLCKNCSKAPSQCCQVPKTKIEQRPQNYQISFQTIVLSNPDCSTARTQCETCRFYAAVYYTSISLPSWPQCALTTSWCFCNAGYYKTYSDIVVRKIVTGIGKCL